MQASCKQNINDSFKILRAINFVHVVLQIGGVLYNPPPQPLPTTKHGGTSTLVMTTSLMTSKLAAVRIRLTSFEMLKLAYRQSQNSEHWCIKTE